MSGFDLNNIVKGPRDHKKMIMVYGVPGIGKTTQCSQLENAFFIPTEDGTAELDVVQYDFGEGRVKVETFEEFEMILDGLLDQGAGMGIKNVVIDSVSALEPLLWDKVCRDGDEKGNVKDNIEDFGYGGGYKRALAKWEHVLNKLRKIRTKLQANVILVGHSQIKNVNDPENDPYERYEPALHKEATALLQRDLDGVLFTKNKVRIREVDVGFNQKKKKGIPFGQPALYTKEKPAFLAKSRSNPPLPEEMVFDLNLVLSSWSKKD